MDSGYAEHAGQVEGFDLVASDGAPVGTVDAASEEVGEGYLLVDVGILHRPVVVPASAVLAVDMEARTVRVDLQADEVRAAPTFERGSGFPSDYRDALGDHFRRTDA